eukprot:92691-Hanusia_phi.AAC.1
MKCELTPLPLSILPTPPRAYIFPPLNPPPPQLSGSTSSGTLNLSPPVPLMLHSRPLFVSVRSIPHVSILLSPCFTVVSHVDCALRI